MCLRVRFSVTISRVYDAEHGVITVPAGLTPPLTLRAVKGVLAEMRVPQDSGPPRCWCGEPLNLSGCIPAQRTGEVTISAS